ncbi:host attachment protein [Sphingomonas sp. CGMCC 1.13654]|uniref:Host attachment protein n=1 Tax=Sphingomonas chungangi TaxID=2683589 RepID=A0A838L1N5_9SPHN|nr:host attachment family protein [Sphingomonas chungangi]MBA2933281.1 host attachment protein [Sphingomonas chungangi]MVW57951.1 Host attachment protein [Sphingomonas chungangi]
MRVPRNSMVLVTDGRKRLFFRNEGDAMAPNLVVVSAVEQNNPKTGEQVTDSQGRASGGGAIPSADAHEVEEQRFAAETAHELSRAALAGEFEALILVAPPKTLGQLRKTLHQEVQKKTLREVAKDVTGHPVGEIEKLLANLD